MTDPWEGLLIVGMGNPILSDDGVGFHVARRLGGLFPGATVETIPMIGMDLLDRMAGHDALVVVDAVATGSSPVGTVSRLELPGEGLHATSSHGPDLQILLSLGRSLGLGVPRSIVVYGMEIGTAVPYGRVLTRELRMQFNTAVQIIADDMKIRLGRADPLASLPWSLSG